MNKKSCYTFVGIFLVSLSCLNQAAAYTVGNCKFIPSQELESVLTANFKDSVCKQGRCTFSWIKGLSGKSKTNITGNELVNLSQENKEFRHIGGQWHVVSRNGTISKLEVISHNSKLQNTIFEFYRFWKTPDIWSLGYSFGPNATGSFQPKEGIVCEESEVPGSAPFEPDNMSYCMFTLKRGDRLKQKKIAWGRDKNGGFMILPNFSTATLTPDTFTGDTIGGNYHFTLTDMDPLGEDLAGYYIKITVSS